MLSIWLEFEGKLGKSFFPGKKNHISGSNFQKFFLSLQKNCNFIQFIKRESFSFKKLSNDETQIMMMILDTKKIPALPRFLVSYPFLHSILLLYGNTISPSFLVFLFSKQTFLLFTNSKENYSFGWCFHMTNSQNRL